MKKILINFLIICTLFMKGIYVYAYDTSTYKIDFPSKYLKEEKYDIWTLKQDKEMITISIQAIDNTTNLDINSMDSKNLDQSIIDELNKSLNDYEEINIKTSDLSLVKVNNYNAIKMNIDSTIPSKEEFVSTVYQSQYIFSSKNYLYYLVVSSSNKELLSSDEINNIINTFAIKDDLKVNNTEEIKKYYITLGVIVLSGVIIMLVAKVKNTCKKDVKSEK